jgi:hypothetical protein
MTQTTYRILPQSVILYGVEVTEPDKAPRVLLTCSTEAAADAWVSEIKRLSAAKISALPVRLSGIKRLAKANRTAIRRH